MIRFWVINLGVMALLIPLGYIKSHSKIRVFFLPFLCLFVLANIILFQKDTWDNRKFLLYWYLGSAGLVGSLVTSMITNKHKGKLFAAVFLLYLATLSG